MKIIVAIAVGFFGLVPSVFAASSAQDGSKMKLGDPIPAVTVPNQDGKPVNLAEEGKTGYTLVYFYPKAMSKGCTAQACSLRDSYTELQQKGVKIFGVSVDTVEAQKKFQDEDHLPFELLSDKEKEVISAFGVPLINRLLITLSRGSFISYGRLRSALTWRTGRNLTYESLARTSRRYDPDGTRTRRRRRANVAPSATFRSD
jgi:thioredoxin-dependent peroxiredoxin